MRAPSITAYCAACDVQVSGGRAGVTHVQGPDGRIYCEECGDAMKRMERMHVPEGAVTMSPRPGSSPNLKSSSGSRKAVPPAKGRPSSPAKGKPASESPPNRVRMIAAGTALIAAILVAGWFLLGREPARENHVAPAREAPRNDANGAQGPERPPKVPAAAVEGGRFSTPPPGREHPLTREEK